MAGSAPRGRRWVPSVRYDPDDVLEPAPAARRMCRGGWAALASFRSGRSAPLVRHCRSAPRSAELAGLLVRYYGVGGGGHTLIARMDTVEDLLASAQIAALPASRSCDRAIACRRARDGFLFFLSRTERGRSCLARQSRSLARRRFRCSAHMVSYGDRARSRQSALCASLVAARIKPRGDAHRTASLLGSSVHTRETGYARYYSTTLPVGCCCVLPMRRSRRCPPAYDAHRLGLASAA